MINRLKNIPWKTILLTLLVWIIFWNLKDTLMGERGLFIFRWIYSNKSCAKNIEAKAYILTDEQVSYMLSHPDEEITQPNQKELRFKNVNVVMRFRKIFNGVAEGKVSWSIFDSGWNSIDVNNIPNDCCKQKYGNIIISIGMKPFKNEEIPPGPIRIRWDDLYLYF